jgi:hypothetical protein
MIAFFWRALCGPGMSGASPNYPKKDDGWNGRRRSVGLYLFNGSENSFDDAGGGIYVNFGGGISTPEADVGVVAGTHLGCRHELPP